MTNASENSALKPMIIIIAVVLVVGIFAFAVVKSNQPGILKLKIGENELEMTMNDGSVTAREMLELLFRNDDAKRESIVILREFGNLYQPDDPMLVDVLAQKDEDSEISKKLLGLLNRLDGPFQRSRHSFYDINDVTLIDAIEQLPFDHPVALKLRILLQKRKGPFVEQFQEVQISVPEGNRIQEGRGAACTGGKFYGRELKIHNQQRSAQVSVYVSGRFPCEPDSELHSLIQLNSEEMSKLLGHTAFLRMEVAYAEILITTP